MWYVSPNPMNSVLKVTLAAAAAILAHLALVLLLPTPGDEEIRLIEDDHDRHVYYQRGSWLPRHQVPFLEVDSEYPELATWFFALPYLALDAPANPAAYESANLSPGAKELYQRYFNLHSAAMALFELLLVAVTAAAAVRLGRDPRRGLFILLPATMFFALSRYDVMPVFLVSLSFLLLLKGRSNLAVFVVSLAVLTKWYAILFLPFYLNYIRTALGRPILPPLLLSAATAAAVVGTTFVTGGLRTLEIATPAARAAAGSDLRLFFEGGKETALAPYLKQGGRISNPGGLFQQMQLRWFPGKLKDPELQAAVLKALALLQFAIVLFAFIVPMRTPDQLVRWMCLATALFILFAKFYSPQWVMWTTALAAVFMRGRLLVLCAVVLEVFLYVQFAIIRGTPLRGVRRPDKQYDLSDLWYSLYDVRIGLTALFALLVAWSLREARRPDREPAAAVANPGRIG